MSEKPLNQKPVKERLEDKKDSELSTQQKIWVYTALFIRAIWPLILYVLMPSLCMSIGYVIGYQDKMTMEEFFTYGVNFYTCLGIFITLWLFHRQAKRRGSTLAEESTLFLRELKPLKSIGFFVFGYASAIAVSSVLTLFPMITQFLGYTKASQTVNLGRDMFLTMITLLVTAPITEEIIFRGFMLNTLLERLEENIAILITSVLFAVTHGNVVWMLYSFFLGQILAKTSMKEDNIAYGVLLHAGFNFTSFTTMTISNNENLNRMFFGSKWLILGYGVLGLAISVLLAAIYTERLDLRRYFPIGRR